MGGCYNEEITLTKRLTKEEFVGRSIEKHGNKYDYSEVLYINNSVKVQILCTKHSEIFKQSPAHHLAGQGCPICRYESSSKNSTLSAEEFIKRARKTHGDKYDYSLVDYKAGNITVSIICNKHQSIFQQKPANHSARSGCPECAKERRVSGSVDTLEQFIAKAIKVHGEKYSYVDTVYERASKKVKIFCKTCEKQFSQTPNSHTSGVGCATCAKTGYSPNKSGYLYVLKTGDITKIGITNFSPEIRRKTLSKNSGHNFEIVTTFYFDSGVVPDAVETTVLRYLRANYLNVTSRFEGHSECFMSVDLNSLLDKIKSTITEECYGNY